MMSSSHYIVAVVGSRAFTDTERVRDVLNTIGYKNVAVVSGGARGADTCAMIAAHELKLQTIIVPALWDVFGRSAGFRRNPLIVDIADEVHAFWDGTSNGTRNTIDYANTTDTPLHIHHF